MEFFRIRVNCDREDGFGNDDRKSNELFDCLRPTFSISEPTFRPPVDLYETREHFYLNIDIAGVDKEDAGKIGRAHV